jgi:hypothetical protein
MAVRLRNVGIGVRQTGDGYQVRTVRDADGWTHYRVYAPGNYRAAFADVAYLAQARAAIEARRSTS